MRNIPKYPYVFLYFKNLLQIRLQSSGNTYVICKLYLLGLEPTEHCPLGSIRKVFAEDLFSPVLDPFSFLLVTIPHASPLFGK